MRNITNEKIVNDLPFFVLLSLAQFEFLANSVVPDGLRNNLASFSNVGPFALIINLDGHGTPFSLVFIKRGAPTSFA